MPNLYGKHLSKVQFLKQIGDITQIAGAVPFVYTSGKAAGTSAVEIRNGSGLRIVVLPGRGMDIAYAEYHGIPFSYISSTGVVAPSHFETYDFLRSFSAGLLTTCGLTYMGAPCTDEGKLLGAHGRISNTPAFDVGITQEWDENDDYTITVRGKVRESTVFGENITLCRSVSVKLGDNRIIVDDKVKNEGFEPQPCMVLYHMNFGYPLISPDTTLETNCQNVRPRDADAEPGLNECCGFCAPVSGYKEQVFYRDSVPQSYAILSNKKLGMSVKVAFSGKELPYLIEWKQMGEQTYVVGIEPATNPPDGRDAVRRSGKLIMLQPQETKKHTITVYPY